MSVVTNIPGDLGSSETAFGVSTRMAEAGAVTSSGSVISSGRVVSSGRVSASSLSASLGRTGRVLIAADECTLQDARSTIASIASVQSRTVRTRGQVFIEVASADQIEPLQTPELMTVTWLVRESRTGAPGTSEPCRPGVALDRAVRAWVSEMSTGDAEVDGGEITAVVLGADVAAPGSVLCDLRLDLMSHLGVAASV